jgi:hypothetical protein
VGLGLPYRGAVHFEGGTFRASVPFQGALERDAEVAIRMTVTNQAPSPRSPAPPPTDPPQTPPETRTDSQLAVITQMQELARLRNAAASPQSTSRSNAALSAASLSGRQANEGASSTITLAARLSAESPDPPSLPVLEALGVVLQMIRGLLTNIPWLGRILLPTIHVPSALEPMENESIAPSAPALRGEEGSVGQASPLQEPSAPVPTPTAAGTTWWKGLLGLGALLIAMAGHHLEPMAKPGKADRRRLPRGGAD